MKTIAIIGTLDTKKEEFLFLKNEIEIKGVKTILFDTSLSGIQHSIAEFSPISILDAVKSSFEKIKSNRTLGLEVMAQGVTKLLLNLINKDQIHGVISMGGGQGTALATSVLKELPIGFPKVLVSTLASIRERPFIGIKDTITINPIVDICGLNEILKIVIKNAAATVIGLLDNDQNRYLKAKPTVAATMLGVTTPCVSSVQSRLETNGFEVMVFHANGSGGKTMEEFIAKGFFDGVIDLTTSEIGHHLFGISGSAGETRLEAGVFYKLPQIVSLGGLDLITFNPPELMPAKYNDRVTIFHNKNVKVIRTSPEENEVMGKYIADKLNNGKKNTCVVIPLKGLSAYDKFGEVFYDPTADSALFASLKNWLSPNIPVFELDLHINDAAFSEFIENKFLEMVTQSG